MQRCLLLAVFIRGARVQGDGGCRVLEIQDCVKGKVLLSHTIDITHVPPPGNDECQIECYLNGACVSYNLGPANQTSRTCELSDTDHVRHPGHVIEKKESEYCPFVNPCTTSTCKPVQICQPDFSWNTWECKACEKPLGMEDGTIPNSAITASSIYGRGKEPWRGRLKNAPTPNNPYPAWVAQKNPKPAEYLQIDLWRVTKVTMVATQGSLFRKLHCVTRYSIAYSFDSFQWIDYQEQGTVKVFKGNYDQDTVVTNVLSEGAVARHFRIVARDWVVYIAMRVELYGCP